MLKRKSTVWLTSIMALALAGTGCGKSEGTSPAPDSSSAPNASAAELNVTEPVTLKLYSHFAAINTPEDVDALFGAVKKKHPNITIELVKGQMADLIAAGEIPDLIATTHLYMKDMLPLGVAGDMNEFVKQYKVDLGKFQPDAIQALKSYGKNGELYGIPYTMNYGLLIYNKDIFEKFGVPYPKDGTKWEEIIDLSKRLTRVDGGVQYRGFDPGTEATFARSYSLGTVDASEKSVLNSEGYKKVFALLEKIYTIPGYIDDKSNYKFGNNAFYKEQTLAMFPTWLAAISSQLKTVKMNWDVAAHPSFDDKPGLGREPEFQSLMVPPMSKNKLAAYRVILTMISEEAQREMNKGYNLTILNDPEMRKQFASSTDMFKGKNLEGIFKVKPAPAQINTVYDSQSWIYMKDAMTDILFNKTDINTALNQSAEKANKYIQEQKALKK
ncbi:MAG: extracellular solute-binding protein family 1 [Paenibacillus sp.]|nr:extracellular solute-binding protein family 1 [Paenibacillus sp.]